MFTRTEKLFYEDGNVYVTTTTRLFGFITVGFSRKWVPCQ